MMTKGYNVYRNDKWQAYIVGRNLLNCKRYIRENLRDTHMGEWHRTLGLKPENIGKTAYHYRYHTTIGVEYYFAPALMDKERV